MTTPITRDHYKLSDGTQTPDTIAMSIVYNLGDALYSELSEYLTHPKHMVKARQKTNDEFIDYVIQLIDSYTNAKVLEARIDEGNKIVERMKHIIEVEYFPGVNNGLNAQMTGHGAMDFVRFAKSDREKDLQSQLKKEQEYDTDRT